MDCGGGYLQGPKARATRSLGTSHACLLAGFGRQLAWDVDGVLDVVNHLGITAPATPPAPRPGEAPVTPEEFLGLLTRPEELVGRLAKPAEFIASAYDYAEHLLTSPAEYAERMTEAIKPLLGAAKDTAASKDDAR